MFDKVVHIKVKLRPTDGISKIKDNEIVQYSDSRSVTY